MAITKIHAIYATVQKAIDYICNPEKTDSQLLVDSYSCSPEIAGIQFENTASNGTGRGKKIAFHIIQSFAPGEVDPETAHKLGEDLARRLLQGNYSYVVATHIDTGVVHNHIIFNAVDNHTYRKYYDSKKSYRKLRYLSDELCKENGLSIIKEPHRYTGLSYEEWVAKGYDTPLREKVRRDIKQCIRMASSYDDFIHLMEAKDYEIKGAALNDGTGKKKLKYISFRPCGYDRYVRGSRKSLGKGFTKEEIAKAIEKQLLIKSAMVTIPIINIEDAAKKQKPLDHIIDTTEQKYQDNPGLKKWAESQNLKAAMYAYTTAGDTAQLQAKIEAVKAEVSDINEAILTTDRKIEKYKELTAYVKNYHGNKHYAELYEKAKNKEAFYEKNESGLLIYEAAERFIKNKGLDPEKITYEQVMKGIENLTAEKEKAKQNYRTKSKELKALEKQMQVITDYMHQKGLDQQLTSRKKQRERDNR